MKQRFEILDGSKIAHEIDSVRFGHIIIPQRYVTFYQKDKHALLKFAPLRANIIEEFCQEYATSRLHYVPKLPLVRLNNQDNFTKYIQEHEAKAYYIIEAQKKALPTFLLANAIQQWCEENLSKELQELIGDDIGDANIRKQRIITFEIHDAFQEDVTPAIQFWIPFYAKDFEAKMKNIVGDLLKIGEKYGYDYQNAAKEDVKVQPLSEEIIIFTVVFVAKYAKFIGDCDAKRDKD